MKVLMLGWEFPPHISGGLGTACYGLTKGLAAHGVEVLFVVPRAHGDEDTRFAAVVGANQVVIEETVQEPSRRVPFERVEEGETIVEERVRVVRPVEPRIDRIATPSAQANVADECAAESAGGTDDDLALEVKELTPHSRVAGAATDAATVDVRDEASRQEALASARGDRVRRSFELLAVDSLLRPYLSEREYVERLSTVGLDARSRSGASSNPPPGRKFIRSQAPCEHRREAPEGAVAADAMFTGSLAPYEHPVAFEERVVMLRRRLPWKRVVLDEREEPGPTRVQRRVLEFSGAYGGNLMDEVARYALAVEQIARKREFDVIHAHDWMSVPAGLAAARASKKPLVLHVHACEHDRSGDRVNTEVKAIEQLGLDGADRVVCVSHYTAGKLRRHYRVDDSKLRIVHNALTQKEQKERVRVEKNIGEPIVLFLGRVTFQKGPDYFLEAASRVVRVRPEVKFVIAGSGDMLPSMIERAARMGLARNVHFTGFLQGEDVERMYAMADVYVMPSVSEPFGISPLEAMALDTPVILSRQSGVSEVLRNALKVDFWDVADMANKILALLSYPALLDQLKEEGREEVRAMRWEHPAGLVRDVYVEVAGSR